jgi:hypothetical protein
MKIGMGAMDLLRSGLAKGRSHENKEGVAMRINYNQRGASTKRMDFRGAADLLHSAQAPLSTAVILGV